MSHDRARELIGSIGGHRVYDVNPEMGFDCLFRGLEITTGSRRINEYRMLLDNVESFGLERLTQQILGLSNVKEACLFPRDRRRVRP